jgi:hypothetical protein
LQSAGRITQGNRQRRIPPSRSEAVAECNETVEKSTLLVLGEVWLKSDRILRVHCRSFSDSASIAEEVGESGFRIIRRNGPRIFHLILAAKVWGIVHWECINISFFGKGESHKGEYLERKTPAPGEAKGGREWLRERSGRPQHQRRLRFHGLLRPGPVRAAAGPPRGAQRLLQCGHDLRPALAPEPIAQGGEKSAHAQVTIQRGVQRREEREVFPRRLRVHRRFLDHPQRQAIAVGAIA